MPPTHGRVAARTPDGEVLTYAELEERSVRLAHVLHDAGLRRGDVVALLTDNDLRAFEVYWAVMRSGLYLTAINHHLSPAEVVLHPGRLRRIGADRVGRARAAGDCGGWHWPGRAATGLWRQGARL